MGYGDISPKNPIEVGITIFVMMVSCVIFAFNINIIHDIIVQMNEPEIKY